MTVEKNVDELESYQSRWLKADDIPSDGDLIVTVMDVNAEPLGEDKEIKLVLVFRETHKHLAVNKTNAKVLTDLYGKNPNDWISKRVALYPTEVEYKGKTSLGVRIRVRPPAQPQPQQPPRDPEQVAAELGFDY